MVLTYEVVKEIENKLGINLENASQKDFKNFLETFYMDFDPLRSISYNKISKDIRELKKILAANGRDISQAKWPQLEVTYYARAINSGRSYMTYSNWREIGSDERENFYNLVLSLGYDGLKTSRDLFGVKPEDYDPVNHTLKCGERLLRLSPFTEKLLKANKNAKPVVSTPGRRIVNFFPYNGSLINFPTYFKDPEKYNERDLNQLSNSIVTGMRRSTGFSSKLWEMNLLKIYDVMRDELDPAERKRILSSGKEIKKWIKDSGKFSFTDEELNDSTFLVKIKTTNPYTD